MLAVDNLEDGIGIAIVSRATSRVLLDGFVACNALASGGADHPITRVFLKHSSQPPKSSDYCV